MNDKFLFHIAYYMTNKKRFDNKNNINKQGVEFNNHVLEGVCQFLKEIDSYEGFSVKKVVLDVNIENTMVSNINTNEYPTLDIEIHRFFFEKEHPFRLTTKHRLSMEKEIENYDWFGYSEDDTIIPKSSMDYIHKNLNPFYTKNNRIYTIPRLVFNKKKEYFYSDIVTPSPHQNNEVAPTNRFGACWIYSKQIMKDWIQHPSFFNFNHPNKDGGIRVKMGSGFIEKKAIVPVDKKIPTIECIHLGYSGKYYFKHPRGFHTLPKKKLCQ